MMQYRKKPVVIEAFQWSGSLDDTPSWFRKALEASDLPTSDRFSGDGKGKSLYIDTLEGEMVAKPGDWIIQGVAGEIYPCKPDIFEATYEKVDDND